MTSSGLYRSLAGCGMCLSIGGLRCRTPTIGLRPVIGLLSVLSAPINSPVRQLLASLR